METFGLIGKALGHSWSPQIHALLGTPDYRLFALEPEATEDFLRTTRCSGLNVTIPYKKTVLPFCASLSEAARATGSVNTLVRNEGAWHGCNTDFDGCIYMVRASGIELSGKKTLVFGSGGVSGTVCLALRSLGAKHVTVISRSGEDNYGNLERHTDAQILVNCTPVGMYPENGKAVISLDAFPACEGVIDLIYNPLKTALLLDAEARGIPCCNGLSMLVAQGARAAELFCDTQISDDTIASVIRTMKQKMRNIVLIGMPGCGKTTLARALAERLQRSCIDLDEEIVRSAGREIPTIFREEGEDGFRARESAELAKWGKESGLILATGGGCITRPENKRLLRQNGVVIWIKRALDALPTDARPLSQAEDLKRMYDARKPLYEAFADFSIENDGSVEAAADKLLEVLA